MSLHDYINALKSYKGFSGDIVCHRTREAGPAVYAPNHMALGLSNDLSPLLEDMGIDRLYIHQAEAIRQIRQGIHTVVATPTASGKSMIYNLPVIDTLLSDPG
ncbi:MAG: DEAD/DEAH box helicase, partial [Desulfobacterales bacterium]|nr:DEAD/DEAH box helicase [Desulfobacterales bacterium]